MRNKKQKDPTPEDAKRCLEIRKRTKRGGTCSAEESDFVNKMFNEHQDWFTNTAKEVFNDTVPFGSLARIE